MRPTAQRSRRALVRNASEVSSSGRAARLVSALIAWRAEEVGESFPRVDAAASCASFFHR
jgi:hypothetical protein